MRFVYSVVRFVPDPARGEFVNVGAIVGSEESSEWQLRQVENPARARLLDDRRSLDAVWSFLDRVGRAIDEYERATETLFDIDIELSEKWLERLYVEHRNVVQLSPPHADDRGDRRRRARKDLRGDGRRPGPPHPSFPQEARRSCRDADGLPGARRTQGRQPPRAGHARHGYHEGFDFAVTNGRALQLTQTWSFQVPDQDLLSEQVKAWGWTVQDVQAEGGKISTAGGTEFEVARDVDIEVVFVPPAAGQDSPALRDAVAVFDTLGVTHRSLDAADAVGLLADQLLVGAGIGRLDLPPSSASHG